MDNSKLYRYFAGEADDDVVREIRAWAEESEENRRRLIAERHLFDALVIHADDIAATGKRRAAGRRSVMRMVTRAAAVIVAALVAIAALKVIIARPAMDDLPMQQLTVPAGQRLNIVLADGTGVWLNSNTKMRFPGAFASDARRIEIDGEAYLTVAKDPERPFTVSTARGDVAVTGTTFNVDCYSGSKDFSVSLIEGSVSLIRPDSTYRLSPGERIELAENGEMRLSHIVDDQFEWINGIISFKDLPLRDIISLFEKYYGVTVEFRRTDIAGVCFSGKFYLDEGISHALNTLRHDVNFDFEDDKDNRHIIIK